MKIYISGKIEGDSNYKEKFRFAEDALKSMFPNGTILNPANAPKGLSNGTYMRLALASPRTVRKSDRMADDSKNPANLCSR